MKHSPADAKRLGVAIRERRARKNLSSSELAAAADLDRTFIWRLEQGDCEPSLSTLRRIADVLGVKVTTLLDA